MRKLQIRRRRGAALVEYGLIVAGVALMCAAAIAVFGHKTNDLISASAAVLPGAHTEDNGAILSGKLIETTKDASGAIILDTTSINTAGRSLGGNVLGSGTPADFGGLVVEPQ